MCTLLEVQQLATKLSMLPSSSITECIQIYKALCFSVPKFYSFVFQIYKALCFSVPKFYSFVFQIYKALCFSVVLRYWWEFNSYKSKRLGQM